MGDKKMTRKEFFKYGFLGFVAILSVPILEAVNCKINVSRRDARYYENLAG